MRILKLYLMVILVFITNISHADIIYLKNGNKIIGQTKGDGKGGILVDGVLYGLDEVDRIILGSETSEESEDIKLDVSGIMLGDEPVAIVNGEVMKVGDKIGKAVVTGISSRYVMFDNEGITYIREIMSVTKKIDKEAELQAYNERLRRNSEVLNDVKKENSIDSHLRKAEELYSKSLNYAKSQNTIEEAVYYGEKALKEVEYALNKADGASYGIIDHLLRVKKALRNVVNGYKKQGDIKKGAEEYLRSIGR